MRDHGVVHLLEGAPIARRRSAGVATSAAVHLLSFAIVAWTTARVAAPVQARRQHRSSVLVFTTPQVPAAGPKTGGATTTAAVSDDLGLEIDAQHDTVDLPGFTFGFGKVIAHAASLFPFLTGSALFDDLIAAPNQPRHGVPNPLGAASGRGSKPPLTMTDSELQRIVDASWARRDRWAVFAPIEMLLERYDPDHGQLAPLLRRYTEQNGLQPYVDMSARDPRLWVQLGLAADHADFLRTIAHYANEHPSTRTTAELLFLLDKLVQGSFDALVTLIDVDPSRDLGWTRRANPAAYQALVTIRTYYQRQLSVRHLTMPSALRRYYDGIRLEILGRLLDITPAGYRRSDALVLVGEIAWREGRQADAVRIWRATRPDPGDEHVKPVTALLQAIQRDKPISAREIQSILDGERGRWLMFSMDRLRQFGYRMNTY